MLVPQYNNAKDSQLLFISLTFLVEFSDPWVTFVGSGKRVNAIHLISKDTMEDQRHSFLIPRSDSKVGCTSLGFFWKQSVLIYTYFYTLNMCVRLGFFSLNLFILRLWVRSGVALDWEIKMILLVVGSKCEILNPCVGLKVRYFFYIGNLKARYH